MGINTSKEHRYTVVGSWPFPLDMLRHDQSTGATPEDLALIERYSQDFAPDRSVFKDVEINLVGPNKPNTARWESFTWRVPSDGEHSMFVAIRERREAEERVFQNALKKLTPLERQVVLDRIASGGRT